METPITPSATTTGAEQAVSPELSDQEVLAQTEAALDLANKNYGGNLFVKIGAKQPDGSVVNTRFFDATRKDGVYLLEVEGQGFKVMETSEDPPGHISNAIAAQRSWVETGQRPMYVGAVEPGHTKHPRNTEHYVLPHGNIASNEEGATIKYRPATEEDVTELLSLNAEAAKQKNLEQIKEQQDRLRKAPAGVARQILPNINTLLGNSPSAEAPTPSAPPAPSQGTI